MEDDGDDDIAPIEVESVRETLEAKKAELEVKLRIVIHALTLIENDGEEIYTAITNALDA
jgi:hypothetical protein